MRQASTCYFTIINIASPQKIYLPSTMSIKLLYSDNFPFSVDIKHKNYVAFSESLNFNYLVISDLNLKKL